MGQSMNQPIHQPMSRALEEETSAGRRAARLSLLMLLGLPVGIALVSVWAT